MITDKKRTIDSYAVNASIVNSSYVARYLTRNGHKDLRSNSKLQAETSADRSEPDYSENNREANSRQGFTKAPRKKLDHGDDKKCDLNRRADLSC